MFTASAALALSDIPWNGPIGAARVGWVNDRPVLNPTRQQMLRSVLDLVIAVSPDQKLGKWAKGA